MGTDSLWPMVTRTKAFDRWSGATKVAWGCQIKTVWKHKPKIKLFICTINNWIFRMHSNSLLRDTQNQVWEQHCLRRVSSKNKLQRPTALTNSQFHTFLESRTRNVGSIIKKAVGRRKHLFQGPEFTHLVQVTMHWEHSLPATANSGLRAKQGQATAARGGEPLYKYWHYVHPCSPQLLDSKARGMSATEFAKWKARSECLLTKMKDWFHA